MKYPNGRTTVKNRSQIFLLACAAFTFSSAEMCLSGGGTTTIVDMEDGELVGKIWCNGVKPNEDRTNYKDKCVGVVHQNSQSITCHPPDGGDPVTIDCS